MNIGGLRLIDVMFFPNFIGSELPGCALLLSPILSTRVSPTLFTGLMGSSIFFNMSACVQRVYDGYDRVPF